MLRRAFWRACRSGRRSGPASDRVGFAPSACLGQGAVRGDALSLRVRALPGDVPVLPHRPVS
eukprot:11691013-Alexandrium_andersonii.AAC.1